MKKIFTAGLVLLSMGMLSAQSNVIDKHFKAYKIDNRFTEVSIAEKTFELFDEIETKSHQEQDLVASIQKIDGIKGYFLEDTDDVQEVYRTGLLKVTSDAAYEELMSMSNAEHNGIVMIRDNAGTIEELMVMFGDPTHFGIFTIYGDLELQAIRNLAAVIEENGEAWFKTFEKMEATPIIFGTDAVQKGTLESKDLAISIFPNPATDHVLLKSLTGATEKYTIGFYSLVGEQINEVQNIGLPYRLELKNVPQGSYFVRITGSDGQFRNYKIVKP